MASSRAEQRGGGAALRAETIEPRILLSATWVDGADVDDASGEDASDTEVELALPAAHEDGHDDAGEVLTGTKRDDVLAIEAPQPGATYTVDGMKGRDQLDLRGYSFDQVTFRDGAIDVDLGDGQKFTVDYDNLEQIRFADDTVRLLDGDARADGQSGATTFVDGDEVFRITLEGRGSVDWAWDAGSDTLTIRDVDGTNAHSVLHLDHLAGDDLRIDSVKIDTALGGIESDTDLGTVTIARKGALGNLVVEDGSVGKLDFQADLKGTTTVDADVGTLRLGDDLEGGARLHVNGDVATLQADQLKARSSLQIDGEVGDVTIARIDARASVEFGGGLDSLRITKGALAGDLTIHGDAGSITIDARGSSDDLAGSLTVHGRLDSLTVGDDLRPGARVVVHGELGSLQIADAIQRNALVQVDGAVGGELRIGRIDAGARVEIGGDVSELAVGRELNGRVVIEGDLDLLTIGKNAKGTVVVSALEGDVRVEQAGKVVTAHADVPSVATYDVARRTWTVQEAAPSPEPVVDEAPLQDPPPAAPEPPKADDEAVEDDGETEAPPPEGPAATSPDPFDPASSLGGYYDLLQEEAPDHGARAWTADGGADVHASALRALARDYGGAAGSGASEHQSERPADEPGSAASGPAGFGIDAARVHDTGDRAGAKPEDHATTAEPRLAPGSEPDALAAAGDAASHAGRKGFLLELWAGLVTFFRGHGDDGRRL